MTLKNYTNLWFFLSLALLFEYLALNFRPQMSALHFLKEHIHSSKFLNQLNLSPEPGRQISLYLGWAGIGLMLSMNVYTIKKRVKFLSGLLPSLASTFDFHIFCGLIGPTLILFHCNLKVRGLVAISFWSMVISATSGILGRYLYGQILSKKQDLKTGAELDKTNLELEFAKAMPDLQIESRDLIMQEALTYVGLPTKIDEHETLGLWAVLRGSILGDIRLFWSNAGAHRNLPLRLQAFLTKWALSTRRAFYLDPLHKIMGYWHAFHLPFAFFMYIAAVIHILAALLLGVKK